MVNQLSMIFFSMFTQRKYRGRSGILGRLPDPSEVVTMKSDWWLIYGKSMENLWKIYGNQ